MRVPLSFDKHDLVDAKHGQLILAPLRSPFQTSYEEAAKSVTGCGNMKREQCRYFDSISSKSQATLWLVQLHSAASL